MATYVVSDIHGCYSALMELLDKAGYKKDIDELIIAGDIIDRGPENYEMLKYMVSKPKNVVFVMGNHDYSFMEYCQELLRLYSSKKVPADLDLVSLVRNSSYNYLFRNNVLDRYDTVYKLITDTEHPVTLEDFKIWQNMIKKFPYYIKRNINNKEYIIVHAGYISESAYKKQIHRFVMKGLSSIQKFYMWAREEAINDGGEDNAIIISGHTPTIASTIFYNKGRIFRQVCGKREFINIDCGYVFSRMDNDANLACIRLDDEKVFYLR